MTSFGGWGFLVSAGIMGEGAVVVDVCRCMDDTEIKEKEFERQIFKS